MRTRQEENDKKNKEKENKNKIDKSKPYVDLLS